MAARLGRLAVGSVKLRQPLQVFRTRIIRTTAPFPRQGLKILQQLAVQKMAPLVPG